MIKGSPSFLLLFIITFPKRFLVPRCESYSQHIMLVIQGLFCNWATSEDTMTECDGFVELQKVSPWRNHPVWPCCQIFSFFTGKEIQDRLSDWGHTARYGKPKIRTWFWGLYYNLVGNPLNILLQLHCSIYFFFVSNNFNSLWSSSFCP